jgi:hypothetical protein
MDPVSSRALDDFPVSGVRGKIAYKNLLPLYGDIFNKRRKPKWKTAK